MAKKNLNREVFNTSRTLEFFSEKELQMQIGHDSEWWTVAILKELIDNALDACESSDIAPEIEVIIENDSFAIRDNGPGISGKIINDSLDYLKRVSDKAFYVSPTRGQMGNALKTVWAAPFVVNGEVGTVEVWSRGIKHHIEVSVDRLSQTPRISLKSEKSDFVKSGTFIKVYWPDLSCSTEEAFEGGFLQVAEDFVRQYAAFNPHATFRIGATIFRATNVTWNKWKPQEPTSPHWYTPETFRDLIAAYVSKERATDQKPKTLREFISEFRGLSSTIKQKGVLKGMERAYLHDLVSSEDVDMKKASKVLKTMQAATTAPKPAALGVIGKEHIEHWMINHAGVTKDSVKYIRKFTDDNLPSVLEIAFGIHEKERRRIVTGLNWSPTLVVPIDEISVILGQMRVDSDDPVTVIIHVARPRFDFTDRGKTRLML